MRRIDVAESVIEVGDAVPRARDFGLTVLPIISKYVNEIDNIPYAEWDQIAGGTGMMGFRLGRGQVNAE